MADYRDIGRLVLFAANNRRMCKRPGRSAAEQYDRLDLVLHRVPDGLRGCEHHSSD